MSRTRHADSQIFPIARAGTCAPQVNSLMALDDIGKPWLSVKNFLVVQGSGAQGRCHWKWRDALCVRPEFQLPRHWLYSWPRQDFYSDSVKDKPRKQCNQMQVVCVVELGLNLGYSIGRFALH